jgi:hypothetical protein
VSAKPDNPPAFPTFYGDRDDAPVTDQGMLLRDWFAGKALQGLRSRDFAGAGEHSDRMNMHHNHADITRMDGVSDRLARIAYEDADAMLKARGEP